MNELSLGARISDIVEDYNRKVDALPQAVADFEAAGETLKAAVTIGGTWGNTSIDTGHVYESTLRASLLKSAWRHVYNGLNIQTIASAKDKRRFEQGMENPIPFTLENIRATFGDYIADPWSNILRGLAEVFCDLDPSYKSHDKVKIGVIGLPKRIILSNVDGYGSWGKDRMENVLNALAAYQGKPLVTWAEIRALLDDENALLEARGVSLKRFKNGNGHLIFEPSTLKDINKALAEYYGEVLADCTENDDQPRQQSTAVAKDLQYYPTPMDVVEKVIDDLYGDLKGDKVLEPQCGCGRFMDALRAKGAKVFGIEVDAGRVQECRAKGHNVLHANFLDTVPTPEYDRVVMNPPFYGKHYAKHVLHALKFLKPDGVLTAILPITARYDHGLLEGRWSDLPVGSFRESGTNINTTVLTIKVPK